MFKLLTSFEGRVRRQTWWLWTVSMGLLSYVASQIVAPMAFGEEGRIVMNPADPFNIVYPTPLLMVMAVVGLLVLWPNLAICVKRRHDRDKSGRVIVILLLGCLAITWASIIAAAMGVHGPWLMATMAVTAPVGIYFYVVLGFLDGTPGPNRYGPSPKGAGGGDVA